MPINQSSKFIAEAKFARMNPRMTAVQVTELYDAAWHALSNLVHYRHGGNHEADDVYYLMVTMFNAYHPVK